MLRFANHHVYSLNSLLTVLKLSCYLLCHILDLALFPFLDIVVVEPRKHMLLMQLLQLSGLRSNVGQNLSDFFLYIQPSWWQQIHFYDHISVVLVCAGRHEATTLFRK